MLIPRAKSTSREFLAFVLAHQGRYLIRQRPAGVVNAQLWEFPNIERAGPNMDVTSAARACLGFTPDKLELLVTIKHTITRYRMKLKVFVVCAGRGLQAASGCWCPPDELERLPFPKAHRRIVAELEKHLQ
jgi:A/G-specific adenine glycosylase